ncbi:MAG: HD domain-containing protein [Actinobacteria bacterium]|nr:MAG: HD domain-containing protein [Actinomycetota bacterium]
MLAIRSKLAISRVLVVGLGLFVLVFSLLGLSSDALIFQSLALAVAIFLCGFLSIDFPQGGRLTIAPAVVLASIFILPYSFAVLGVFVGALAQRLFFEKKLNFIKPMLTVSRFVLSMSAAWLVFTFLGGQVNAPISFWYILPLTVASSSVFFLLDIGLNQFFFSMEKGVSFLPVYIGTIRLLFPMYSTFAIISLLMAIMYSKLHVWSYLLFALPLLVAGHSFKLLLNIRRTYKDTISALSSVIEAGDPSKKGHAQRVTNLSIDVGRELGMFGKDLERLGYAASLHDIGQLGFDDSAKETLFDTEDLPSEEGLPLHAKVGAEIISNVDYLKDSAELVKYHHEPFVGLGVSKPLPFGSRIISIVSRFDEMTHAEELEERLDTKQAVSALQKDQGLIYDPRIMRAFTNVLKRQGKLV